MDKDIVLMKGNEAIAHAAIRYGYDGFFGYPITPQSEILETLAVEKPWETTGMVVLQSESELASINMIYAGGATGKLVFTSSSSPGIALMQEGISYMAGCEIPGVIVSVQRGGPGLGTIQPSQSDYFQAVYGGGNGDYHVIVIAPDSVQEMADHMGLAADLAFRWRIPVMVLSDGVIGQMMEKVTLPPFVPRKNNSQISERSPWATNGLNLKSRKNNVMTSLELEAPAMEERNKAMTAKYNSIAESEVRYEETFTEDAEYLIIGFGSAARVALGAIESLRKEGIKAGLFRPITLWPFPEKRIKELASQVKHILTVEFNEGQMVRDVRYSVEGKCQVSFFGHSGGVIPDPSEIYNCIKNIIRQEA